MEEFRIVAGGKKSDTTNIHKHITDKENDQIKNTVGQFKYLANKIVYSE